LPARHAPRALSSTRYTRPLNYPAPPKPGTRGSRVRRPENFTPALGPARTVRCVRRQWSAAANSPGCSTHGERPRAAWRPKAPRAHRRRSKAVTEAAAESPPAEPSPRTRPPERGGGGAAWLAVPRQPRRVEPSHKSSTDDLGPPLCQVNEEERLSAL
jgi:hypothetical protein